VTQVQPLLAQLHGVLVAIRIERPPLGEANIASICQSRYIARSLAGSHI